MHADTTGAWPSYPLRLHVVLFSPFGGWDFYEWYGTDARPTQVSAADDEELRRWDSESPAARS